MANFIEELYYGKIDLQARITKQNKTIHERTKILVSNEDLLMEALSEGAKNCL